MNRRSLAIGAAIILPAGFAALHTEAGGSPSPPDFALDTAIRAAHRAFSEAVATQTRIFAMPSAACNTQEEEAQNATLDAAIHRECDAVETAAGLPASTPGGLRLKAAILAEALALAEDFALDTTSRQVRLAASVAADIARLFPTGGGQA